MNNLPEPVAKSRSKSVSKQVSVRRKSASKSKSKSKSNSVAKRASRSKSKGKGNEEPFVLHREHGELEATYQERLRFVQEAKIPKTKANQGRLSDLSFIKVYVGQGMQYSEEVLKELKKCV